jgi:hypothetical protein
VFPIGFLPNCAFVFRAAVHPLSSSCDSRLLHRAAVRISFRLALVPLHPLPPSSSSPESARATPPSAPASPFLASPHAFRLVQASCRQPRRRPASPFPDPSCSVLSAVSLPRPPLLSQSISPLEHFKTRIYSVNGPETVAPFASYNCVLTHSLSSAFACLLFRTYPPFAFPSMSLRHSCCLPFATTAPALVTN